MATKAERFKSDAQRAAQGGRGTSAKKKPGTKRAGVPHKTAARARKNSAYEFEVSEGRASRKSSRRSPTHLKTDATLRKTALERGSTPKQRAMRATDKGG